ncbi:MAG: DUF2968 domain-containing protein [Rhodanobacter sp.]
MTRSAGSRRFVVSMIAMVLACTAISATASSPAAAGGDTSVPAPGQVSSSTVDDLRKLIDSHQLVELRTTYNGAYGASLLFEADKLSYYVALFHGKEFWRVIQTASSDDAESIYRTFADQTHQLAQVDLDTIRLEASKKFAEHMVALNQQRLQNMQQDASYQQQQARQVAVQQQQAQQQTASLTADLRATNSQLDAVQQQIRTLETQQTNPSLVLPTPEVAPVTPPAQATPPTSAPSTASQASATAASSSP